MAAWIESHQTLKEHPKLYTLMSALNVSRSAAIGHLHLLWWWAVDYATDGELHVDENQIARAAEWPGVPKTLHDALVSSGFIDVDENGKRLHDWLDYCGQLVEKRLKRLKEKRRKTASVRLPLADVRRKKDAYPTQPNPTVPNPNEPKRTEPKKSLSPSGNGDHRVKEFIDFFFTEFRNRTGEVYHVNGGKDGATVKTLLRTFDLETLKRRAALFFDSTDPFIVKGGKTISMFGMQVNKFVTTTDPGAARMKALADMAEKRFLESKGEQQ